MKEWKEDLKRNGRGKNGMEMGWKWDRKEECCRMVRVGFAHFTLSVCLVSKRGRRANDTRKKTMKSSSSSHNLNCSLPYPFN